VAELLFWSESMDSWFFLSFTPLIYFRIAGQEEAQNLAGECPPPDSDPLCAILLPSAAY
jgi:hypothetical protein